MNLQGLLAEKEREGRCSGDYFFFTLCEIHFPGSIEALDAKGTLNMLIIVRQSQIVQSVMIVRTL